MILVSLRLSGSCVEMMEFSGSMNGGILLGVLFNKIPTFIAYA